MKAEGTSGTGGVETRRRAAHCFGCWVQKLPLDKKFLLSPGGWDHIKFQ